MQRSKDPINVLSALILGGIALILAGMAFYGISYLAEQDRIRKAEEAKLQAEIQQAKQQISGIIAHRKDEDFSEQNFGSDPWGTEYRVLITESEEKVFMGCAVISAGPDKQFFTSDDIVEKNDDLNWTKAGQAIGTRTGRTTRGFIKGLWESGDDK